jgi:hypothetical protein
MSMPPREKLDMNDPQVQADIERAKKAANLAGMIAPGAQTSMHGEPQNRRGVDLRGPKMLEPNGATAAEVLRLVMGVNLSSTRAAAVKRVARRIKALMGPDAPPGRLTKWWVAEILGMLHESHKGIVRLGALRMIAESIGLLRPGSGLMVSKNASTTWVPKVTFATIKPEPKPKVYRPLNLPKLADKLDVKVPWELDTQPAGLNGPTFRELPPEEQAQAEQQA